MLRSLLKTIYGSRVEEAMEVFETLILERVNSLTGLSQQSNISQEALDSLSLRPAAAATAAWQAPGPLVISYGDSLKTAGQAPLRCLERFLSKRASFIGGVHILPCFPSSSDDGFAVSDYLNIDPELGTWSDVTKLAAGRVLMLDAVVNHCSISHPWFRAFLAGDERYAKYFIERAEDFDTSQVVRPRTSALFSRFESAKGPVEVWTTFSADQVDLNFAEPRVAAQVLAILCEYAARGAKIIRLDAVGFIWKQSGTSCLNLPAAHALVKLYRWLLERLHPGTALITETNVPEAENRAYFGSGDEASLVYQFSLPPLLLQAFISGRASHIMAWLSDLAEFRPPPNCGYFNFLASHDGIGLRPTESWLNDTERAALVSACLARGGQVSYRSGLGGQAIPYELNINYLDALSPPEATDNERAERMLAAHAILFALPGIPAVYIHSLLGSRNWPQGIEQSGMKRRINRQKLDLAKVEAALDDPSSLRSLVFYGLEKLAIVRRELPVFSELDSCISPLPALETVVAFELTSRLTPQTSTRLTVVVNISAEAATYQLPLDGQDAISGRYLQSGEIELAAFEALWIK